jgi:hypothetical protein
MNKMMRRYLILSLGSGAVSLALPAVHAAQQPPAIDGTLALEGTVDQTYRAANAVIVSTTDGLRHLFHLTGKTVVHGAESGSADVLRGLETGSTVVVHYTAADGKRTALELDRIGSNGLKEVEGVVTRVDRGGRKISIRLDDGSTQTLRLAERAASDVGRDVDHAAADTARVIVYFTDEAGEQVVHYFKKVS